MDKEHLQKLVSFMQQKGFVWGPEPEIYGGLSGFYTYGPLGKLLKNNVEKEIRKLFSRNDFMEVECPTVMPSAVWEASGHIGGFTDPLIEDTKGNVYRADTLIQEFFEENNIKSAVPQNASEIINTIKKHKINAPSGNPLKEELKDHSLMMKTTIGVDTEAYNRPETATTTYLPFIRYDDFFRNKYPFGVFQIGKAYRNEISPRQHLLRTREFTQAEAQLFILPGQKDKFEGFDPDVEIPLWMWKLQEKGKEREILKLSDAVKKKILGSQAYAWTLALAYDLFFSGLGVPKERIRLRQHGPDEKAFYAADAWDVEIQTRSFGWVEVCGIHDRTDYDLKQHSEHSGKSLQTSQEGEKVVPHILEIAFGTDRPVFALLDIFYDYQKEEEGKTTLRIPSRLAPQKVAVFPLMRKEELKAKAIEVYEMLKCCYSVKYDETASIGKRYLRASEEGIPWCITIDYDTLEDSTVTVRDRDTEEQVRVKVHELKRVLCKLSRGEELKGLGTPV